ncbi:MAG: hypothetical protein WBO39_06085 [Ferruginibacter sp.]
MKKLIAIFFFSIYLFSTTEAHQFFKLPVVFQHFNEHKQEDKNITLLRFLVMHYDNGNKKDKDYDRDMQLPFKTSDNCLTSVTPDFIPFVNTVTIEKPTIIIQKASCLSRDQSLRSVYPASIWQPPKSC